MTYDEASHAINKLSLEDPSLLVTSVVEQHLRDVTDVVYDSVNEAVVQQDSWKAIDNIARVLPALLNRMLVQGYMVGYNAAEAERG
jgi:hypothetical protein